MTKKRLSEYMAKLGRKGGATTLKRYGKAHYRKTAARMNEVLKARRAKKKN